MFRIINLKFSFLKTFTNIQFKINYLKNNKQILYTGGSDAIIHIYDASTLK